MTEKVGRPKNECWENKFDYLSLINFKTIMNLLRYNFYNIDLCNMCGNKFTGRGYKILGQRLNQSQGYNPRNKIGITTSVVQCNNCGLICSNPQPVPLDIQDHYGLPTENYWKSEYFQYDPNYFAHQIATTNKLLNFHDGKRALDIGAGIGKCMISLQHAGFESYGLEPSVTFYQKALEVMKINPDRLKRSMIENVEYPDSFFDFITFGAVLEHLYDPAKSIEKALKWLKPGGLIHIEVPSAKHLIPKIFNFYFRMRGTNYVNNLSPMHMPYHLYEFDIRSFIQHSRQNDYEIVHYEYYVCDIYFIPKLVHPFLKWYMKKTNTGMQLAIWLRKSI